MKVNWTKELPTEAGWYWLYAFSSCDLVKVYETFGDWYLVYKGGDPCNPYGLKEYADRWDCQWAPAELPEPPED